MTEFLKFLLSVLSDTTFEKIIIDMDKTIENRSTGDAVKLANMYADILIFYFNNTLASNEIFSIAKKYLTKQTCERITVDYNRNKLLLLIKK